MLSSSYDTADQGPRIADDMDPFRLSRKLLGSLSWWNVRRAWHLVRTEGPLALWDRFVYVMGNRDVNRYRELEPRPRHVRQQRRNPIAGGPKISLAVATFNTPLPYLREVVQSVFEQSYPNWELCIADGASTADGVVSFLENLARTHPDKVRFVALSENRGIGGNQNEAIALCTGDYVGIIDHDDLLTPNALYEMASRLAADPDVDLIYSDESIIDAENRHRLSAHLKPDYAPDTLCGSNFVCHLTLYRKELLDALGGFRLGFDGAQDFDLVLRATELISKRGKKIVHIPKVLYLWRMHAGSTAMSIDTKPYAVDAGRRAVQEHLERLGRPARIEIGVGCTYRIHYELVAKPKISVIIPNKDQHHLLHTCLDGVLRQSSYPNLEVVVVENGSESPATFLAYRRLKADPRVRIVTHPDTGRFNFPKLVNFGAREATGDYLLLLNNDTEPINADWIEKMLEYGQRDDVGAVGAKLLYGENNIQHGGVILGIFGVAGHSHRGAPAHEAGYLGRLCTAQNLSAVTAACLLVRKSLYEQLGGFDEKFAVAFNDIDFCLRLRELGKLIVWTPEAVLYHYESRTRGYEDTPEKLIRFKREIAMFQERWRDFLKNGDPYYNPNLTLLAEDFRIGSPFDGITMPFPY